MQTIEASNSRRNESGNVLFLILIAVALFAALSYAVTQSTRSGGGDAGGETSKINSAQLTQYPAGVRSALVRSIIGGTDVNDLSFNTPANFGTLGTSLNIGVFHPQGSGATYAQAPADVMANKQPGTWRFNSKNEIKLIGTSGTSGVTADTAGIIAFLPGIALTVCKKINAELGLPATVPVEDGILYAAGDDMVATGGTTSTPGTSAKIQSGGGVIGGDVAALDGQPFGCFQVGTGTSAVYVYYHVLIER